MNIIQKFLLSIVGFFLISSSAFAQEKKGCEASVWVSTASASTSSAPVTGLDLSAKTGYGVGVACAPAEWQNWGVAVGISQQNYDTKLSFLGIGNLDSQTAAATARYNFRIDNAPVTPYLGAGIYNTSISGSLASGKLQVSNASKTGIVIEAGLGYQINKDLSIGINVSHYNGNIDLDIGTPSGVPMTKGDLSSRTETKFLVSFLF